MNQALLDIAQSILMENEDPAVLAAYYKALDSQDAIVVVATLDKTISYLNTAARFKSGLTLEDCGRGVPCSQLGGGVEETELCAFSRLENGENVSYFSWDGETVRCETAYLCDPVGNHIGFLQVMVPESGSAPADQTNVKALNQGDIDRLTGLFTRQAFYNLTRKLLDDNPETSYVMVYWDVMRFKVINDVFSRSTGDRVLVNIADTVQQLVGDHGTAGRLGGDQFVFCIPESLLHTAWLAQHSEVTLISDTAIYTFKSTFGIYSIKDRTASVDSMVDRAIVAQESVSEAQLASGRSYAYYDEGIRNQMLEEQALMSQLDFALQEGQFKAYLQPVYNIKAGVIASAEALVRWEHPNLGLIPPDRFIRLFEQNGLITTLDKYIWDQTAGIIERRIATGKHVVPVSINVSRIDFFTTTLVDDLSDIVHNHNLPHELLRVEVTESAYTDDPARILGIVKRLRARGFTILLDDFGSGYSSLNTLKDIPIDILKLDMKFLEGFEDSDRAANIIECIVSMAHRLGLKVIAEGVETRREAKFLYSVGCNLAQGYLYSRPVRVERFLELLDDKNAKKLI